MAGIKIVDLPALGRDLISTDLLEVSLNGSGSRKITGQEIMNASKLAVGNTPIINGAVGQVLFQGTGNVLQESANFFWDNTNGRLGIGTSSPSTGLDARSGFNLWVGGGHYLEGVAASGTDASVVLRRTANNGWIRFGLGVNSPVQLAANTNTGEAQLFAGSGGFFPTFYSNGSERMRIPTTGNVLIGTTTDAGFRLDVNGTARVQNTLTVTKGAGNSFTFEAAANGSDLSIRFFKLGAIDVSLSTRNATNIGSQSISDGLGLNGGFLATRLGASLGVIAVTNTGGDSQFHAASQNGFSSYVSFRETGVSDRGILGFQNGTSYLQIRTNGATNMSNGTLSTAFFSTGNVGINTTTDAGFKLDVNGTARVSGADNENVFTVAWGGSNSISLGSNTANSPTLRLGSIRIQAHPGGSSLSFSNGLLTTVNVGSNTNSPMTLAPFVTGTSTGNVVLLSSGARINAARHVPTSGLLNMVMIGGAAANQYMDFAPSSGNAEFNQLNILNQINTTGTYAGIVRGIYYNPILTSMTGVTHFAFHSTSGRVRFEGLPTSPTGLNAGDIYNDGGTLRIV